MDYSSIAVYLGWDFGLDQFRYFLLLPNESDSMPTNALATADLYLATVNYHVSEDSTLLEDSYVDVWLAILIVAIDGEQRMPGAKAIQPVTAGLPSHTSSTLLSRPRFTRSRISDVVLNSMPAKLLSHEVSEP